MLDGEITSYDLPVHATTQTPAGGNVIELRPSGTLH